MGPEDVGQPLVVWGGGPGMAEVLLPLLLHTQAVCADGV